jgi:hypothetical protein
MRAHPDDEASTVRIVPILHGIFVSMSSKAKCCHSHVWTGKGKLHCQKRKRLDSSKEGRPWYIAIHYDRILRKFKSPLYYFVNKNIVDGIIGEMLFDPDDSTISRERAFEYVREGLRSPDGSLSNPVPTHHWLHQRRSFISGWLVVFYC